MVQSFTYSRCFAVYNLENPQPWDEFTLSKSSGLLQQLNSFLFHLLIALFSKVLQQSSILCMVL